MSKFMTPPLLITEYYDSLISQLDIYIEERIKEFKENGLQLERIYTFNCCGCGTMFYYNNHYDKYGVKTLKNPYEKQKYSIKPTKIPIEITDISQAEEYMNKVRQTAIDEIRKVEEENLKFYKANKEEFKVDRKTLTEEKLEELKSQLFANRYCFLVKKQPVYSTLFELHIVITDFYLRESEIDYIRNEVDEEYEIKHTPTKLDKRFLLANQVHKYFDKIIDSDLNGYEIIHIKQKNLFKIKPIEVKSYNNRNLSFTDTDLSFDTDIDLSSIKSLNLQVEAKITDLSAFVNLEYLYINCIKLCQSPFQNLKKLIKIQIFNCDVSEFDFDSLNSLTSLQIIDIYLDRNRDKTNLQSFSFEFDLTRLINLKWLDLNFIQEHEINNLELITYGSYNQLTFVRVNNTMIDFSKQLYLPELICLYISFVDLSQQINQHSFYGMSSLIELNLNHTSLINVDFLDTDRLGNLEKLNLSKNQITVLGKGAFTKLKNLKMLDLSSNQIKELVPGVFEGLEYLKQLDISSNILDSKPIDKTIFSMSSLIELNLNKTSLTSVDFVDTDRLGKLEKLNLSNNQITVLRKGAFCKLKNLKKLDLSSNQIKELIPDVFEGLECLKKLDLLYNNINVESIDKTVFDGLKCLKDLLICGYAMRHINVDYLIRDGLNVI